MISPGALRLVVSGQKGDTVLTIFCFEKESASRVARSHFKLRCTYTSTMIICLGPICVPIWHLGVIGLFFLRPLIGLFHRLCGRRNTENETAETEQSVKNSAGCTYTPESGNELHKRTGARGVTPIRSQGDFEALLQEAFSKGVCLFVDFNAKWCGPCRRIAPLFERLAASYRGVFASVDVDDCGDFDDMPEALPTFKVYKENNRGEAVDSLVGANPSSLEALVAKHATRAS